MELQSILSADYLDIIFDNRNKNYGGYELRKHYNQRATKAITVVLSTALLLLGAHAFASRFKPDDVVKPPILTSHNPTILDVPTRKIEPPKVQDIPKPVAPTIVFKPPVIAPDIEVITKPPTQEEMKGKEIGNVNSKGNGGNEAATTTILTNGGGEPVTGVTEKPREEGPVEYVEQMPEFDGSISEYLGRNIQYPELAKQTNTSGRVVIKFVVNEDGSISNAKVVKGIGAGCEEEAIRVINGMPKWKAGKTNGKAVKVYFTVPVTFKLN